LLSKAGLFDPAYYNFPFLTEGEFYTVFVPSAAALEAFRADTLSKQELNALLRYHFVKEHLIFTDGKKEDRAYPTTLVDERSTAYTKTYSTINIQTGRDVILILDKNGGTYLEIAEDGDKTNQLVSYDPNETTDSQWDFITTGVIHEIDKVLVKDSIEIR
jgi:uncharacterized surface protein with fasciclin (FAS1) repeats